MRGPSLFLDDGRPFLRCRPFRGDLYYSVRGGEVSAPELEGFTFVGWYKDYDYTDQAAAAVSFELTLHVNPTAEACLTAVYSPAASFAITYGSETKTLTAGAEAEFSFSGDGRKLLYWTDGNGNLLSKAAVCRFTVTRDLTLCAVSAPQGNAGDRALVIFESDSGQLISAEIYDIYDTIVFPGAPPVSGKTFDHWDMSADEIRRAMETGDTVRVRAVYVDAEEESGDGS